MWVDNINDTSDARSQLAELTFQFVPILYRQVTNFANIRKFVFDDVGLCLRMH